MSNEYIYYIMKYIIFDLANPASGTLEMGSRNPWNFSMDEFLQSCHRFLTAFAMFHHMIAAPGSSPSGFAIEFDHILYHFNQLTGRFDRITVMSTNTLYWNNVFLGKTIASYIK